MRRIPSALAILFLLLSFYSIQQWSRRFGAPTAFWWMVQFGFLFCGVLIYNQIRKRIRICGSRIIWLYFAYLGISIVRGCFAAEYYWDWKQLVANSMFLSLPLFALVGQHHVITGLLFKHWLKYGLILFPFVLLFFNADAYGRYVVPATILMLFFWNIPPKWRFGIIVIFALVVVLGAGSSRANILRLLVPLAFSFLLLVNVPRFFLRISAALFFLMPILFILLGLMNVFNIFRIDEFMKSEILVPVGIGSESDSTGLLVDTRTFLFEEVYLSSVIHDYEVFGRTPARGYVSDFFDNFAAYQEIQYSTGFRGERYASEIGNLNIYTWMGLVGLCIYSLLFINAVFLAVWKSNNRYIAIIGLYVAFRWAFGWVEDYSRFDTNMIVLWLMVGMCYSPDLRKMRDSDFNHYLNWIAGSRTANSDFLL